MDPDRDPLKAPVRHYRVEVTERTNGLNKLIKSILHFEGIDLERSSLCNRYEPLQDVCRFSSLLIHFYFTSNILFETPSKSVFFCKLQRTQADEGRQLHSDRSRWTATEDARRERFAIQPGRLLLSADEGFEGRRSLDGRKRNELMEHASNSSNSSIAVNCNDS